MSSVTGIFFNFITKMTARNKLRYQPKSGVLKIPEENMAKFLSV
jgi:hypothetical protein